VKTTTPSLHHSITTIPSVRLFASAKSWIEGEALRQLYATSKLEGVRLAVGFPDLHPGKGSAIGAAFVIASLPPAPLDFRI
jgi:release factor H-coupled RctB family protein